jgi:hypothetical protein
VPEVSRTKAWARQAVNRMEAVIVVRNLGSEPKPSAEGAELSDMARMRLICRLLIVENQRRNCNSAKLQALRRRASTPWYSPGCYLGGNPRRQLAGPEAGRVPKMYCPPLEQKQLQ